MTEEKTSFDFTTNCAELEQAAEYQGDLTVEEMERAMRNFCSQCGQKYTDWACGFGHGSMRMVRQRILNAMKKNSEKTS
jgi:hypothetical protein